MRKILFVLCTFISLAVLSQEEGEKTYCKEIDKKLEKIYLKGTDRKIPKPERLKYLRQCLEEDPDFAEANLAMGLEIIVHCKLEDKPFTPAVPFFKKAISACPQVHSEAYYYIGFDYYEQLNNDSAIKYLDKFIKFKDDNEKKFGKDYEAELSQAKGMLGQVKKEKELNKKVVPFDPKVVTVSYTHLDVYKRQR